MILLNMLDERAESSTERPSSSLGEKSLKAITFYSACGGELRAEERIDSTLSSDSSKKLKIE